MVDTRELIELGTHVEVSPETLRLAKQYRIPIEVLALIRGAKIEKIKAAYRAANDRDYFEFVKLRQSIELLGRISGFSVTPRDDGATITLVFPTVKVLWKRDDLGDRDPDELVDELREWLYVKARKVIRERKTRDGIKRMEYWVAEKVKVLRAEEDVDAWVRLMEKHGPFKAAALALGYDPEKFENAGTALLILTRILQILTPEPVHMVELTAPGTGKTTTALRLKFAARWEYFNKPPTPASLVGDARTGRVLIKLWNGIWFDEFDKWPARRQGRDKLVEAFEILLTGMEQGWWTREAGGEKRPQDLHPIPLRFTGNITTSANPRAKVEELLMDVVGIDGAAAFLDRIALAISAPRREYANDIIRGSLKTVVPRAALIRGMIRWAREEWYNYFDQKLAEDVSSRVERGAVYLATTMAMLTDTRAEEWIELFRKWAKEGINDPDKAADELATLASRARA